MNLFDTHAHLQVEDFTSDLDQVIARAHSAGVARMMAIGITAQDSAECVDIAKRFPSVRAAVGVQPNHTSESTAADWDEVVRLSALPEVVALGETGLDRYWDRSPFDVQQDWFDRHLRHSQATGLPVVIHMRDCGPDIVAMVREAVKRAPVRGVMHSFTGDEPTMRECLDLGLHISFAGMVTYKKSDELRRLAALVPADRLLVETDCPYLSPHPMRSQRRNEPALVVHTAQCLADVRGVTPEKLAESTFAASESLFRRPSP
jgi:TatD DNase family protein